MNPGGVLHAAGFGIWTMIAVAVIATVGAMLIHTISQARKGRGATPKQTHNAPPRREQSPVQAPAPVFTPRGPDLPDWSAPDSPMFTFAELDARMREFAARGGLPENVLAHVGEPTGRDGENITIEGPNYVFSYWERGGPMHEKRSVIADQILYFALKDRARMRAYMELMGQELSPEEHAARLAEREEGILAAMDPRWARQYALDRQQTSGN